MLNTYFQHIQHKISTFIKPVKAIASIPELRKNLGVEKESESGLTGEKTFEMDEELVELFLLALAPL